MARERHFNLKNRPFVVAVRPSPSMSRGDRFEYWVYHPSDPKLYYASGGAPDIERARRWAEIELRETLQRIDPEPREPRERRDPRRRGYYVHIYDRHGAHYTTAWYPDKGQALRGAERYRREGHRKVEVVPEGVRPRTRAAHARRHKKFLDREARYLEGQHGVHPSESRRRARELHRRDAPPYEVSIERSDGTNRKIVAREWTSDAAKRAATRAIREEADWRGGEAVKIRYKGNFLARYEGPRAR